MHHLDALPSPAPSGAVALDHWGLMRASGPDAASFLHSQLTNDITHLGADTVRLAGFCSAKGRLQASFTVWSPMSPDLLLACHASVLPAIVKRLSMFVLRARCKLTALGDECRALGLIGEAATAARRAAGLLDSATWQHRSVDGGSLLALPAVQGLARAVWVAAPDAPVPGHAAPAAPVSLDLWRLLEVRAGVPLIEAASVDHFVPQMLNYELIGGVDFRKGCYPGQEVVARSQYRGTVKRRMARFVTDAGLRVADEVFAADDPAQPAGEVVNVARRADGGSEALVEVKLSALGAGPLRLGAADGPALHRADLPYALPADTDSPAPA